MYSATPSPKYRSQRRSQRQVLSPDQGLVKDLTFTTDPYEKAELERRANQFLTYCDRLAQQTKKRALLVAAARTEDLTGTMESLSLLVQCPGDISPRALRSMIVLLDVAAIGGCNGPLPCTSLILIAPPG